MKSDSVIWLGLGVLGLCMFSLGPTPKSVSEVISKDGSGSGLVSSFKGVVTKRLESKGLGEFCSIQDVATKMDFITSCRTGGTNLLVGNSYMINEASITDGSFMTINSITEAPGGVFVVVTDVVMEGGYKWATTESGSRIQVDQNIREGDKVLIN